MTRHRPVVNAGKVGGVAAGLIIGLSEFCGRPGTVPDHHSDLGRTMMAVAEF